MALVADTSRRCELSRTRGAHLARTNDLLARIKVKLPQLEELLAPIEDRSGEEDGVYRFYHQSFNVFDLQKLTLEGLKLIEEIGGETDPPHPWYCQMSRKALDTRLSSP
jgi:hypothetical protein